MSAPNPYALQLAQLVEAAGLSAPSGYAGRLYFHITACCLVFVLSIIYLVLSAREHRNRGRRLALVRLQRIRSGNLIVLNTLFVFVIFTALSSVVFIIQKWWQVRIFVQKKAPYDLVIIIIQTWSMPLMSGWTYIFSNFAAALQVGRGRVGFDGVSRVLVSLHNVSFFGVFITFFASTIPIAVYANRASNDAIDATLALMAYLDAASKIPNPADVPEEINAAIANAASTVASRNAVYFKLFRGVVGIATATVILLGIIAVLSLTSVLKIRKQSQWHRSASASASVFVSVEQRTVAERDNPDGTVDMTSSSQPEPTVRPVTQHLNLPSFTRNREAAKSAKSKAMSQQQKDIAALHRLASDLSVSTPLSLLLIAFMIGCGVSGVVRIDRPHSWAEIELLLDGYGWAWEPVHIIMLSAFIYNLTHNPLAHSNWSGQKNSQSGVTNAAGTNVLSIQLQAYPAPLNDGLSDVELRSNEKALEIDEKGFEAERM